MIQGEAWINLRTRRVAIVDAKGMVWRLVAAGPVEDREAKPIFDLVPQDDGSFELCFGARKRRLRLETMDETPEPPAWLKVDAQKLAGLVLGNTQGGKTSWAGTARKALGFALEVTTVAAKIKRVLGQV